MRRVEKPGPRRFGVRWPYVILGLLLILFAVKFVQKTRELQQLNRQASALQLANQQTMRENVHLRRDIHYYGTSTYIQSQARSVFGFTMPGEVAIVATSPSHPRYTRAPVVVRHIEAPPPVWRQWWRSFFG